MQLSTIAASSFWTVQSQSTPLDPQKCFPSPKRSSQHHQRSIRDGIKPRRTHRLIVEAGCPLGFGRQSANVTGPRSVPGSVLTRSVPGSVFTSNAMISAGAEVEGSKDAADVTKHQQEPPLPPLQDLPLPPGNAGLPLVGHTLEFFKDLQSAFPSLLDRVREEHGDVARMKILGHDTAIMAGPTAADFVLNNEHILFRIKLPDSARRLLGAAISVEHDPAAHLEIRAAMSSAMAPAVLKNYLGVIETRVTSMLDRWTTTGQVAVVDEMKEVTMSIIAGIILGVGPDVNISFFVSHFHSWLRGLFSVPINLPFTDFGKALKAREQMLLYVGGFLEQRKKDIAEGKSAHAGDFLSLCLDEGVSDEKIKDNLVVLFFAGHDSSASALTNILGELERHPEVLQKVRAEHEAIRESKAPGEHLVWEDIAKMKYTDMVIKEGMRLWPPVGSVFREAMRDVEWRGFRIPEGWRVTVPIRSAMWSAENWEEPKAFRPERFAGGLPDPFKYMPFGQGARMCPGQHLARLEMLVVLHHLSLRLSWRGVGEDKGTNWLPIPLPRNKYPIQVQPLGSAMV